jgi:hypothetical protein
MKLTITMKTPDCVDDAIRDAREADPDIDEGEIKEVCSKWFEYGEYLYVEVDTSKKTARVLEA